MNGAMRTLLLSCFVLLPLALKAAVLPALAGKDLAGAPLALPTALSGRAGVLVVGLSRGSGKACQAWEDRLWADLGSDTRVAVFTAVQLEGAPGFVLPFILKGIKKQKDQARFGRILILRDGRKALEAAVGYDPAAPDDAYVLLLDRDGGIRWSAHDADLKALPLLKSALAPLKGEP